MSKLTPQEVVQAATDLRDRRKRGSIELKGVPDEWIRYVETTNNKIIFTVPNSKYQIILYATWRDPVGLVDYHVYDDYGILIAITASFIEALSYTDFNPTDLLASEVI
jgi:hypothetical protein